MINAYNQFISGFGRKRTPRNLCAELLFLFQAKEMGCWMPFNAGWAKKCRQERQAMLEVCATNVDKQLSSVQNPGWLFYIEEDEMLPISIRIPINQSV